jgi:uncharacterized membrane protein YsdA (DUF1294 family)
MLLIKYFPFHSVAGPAWVAQRRLRHKCSKGSYQFVFCLIVLGWQVAALDSFHDWELSRAGLKWFDQTS